MQDTLAHRVVLIGFGPVGARFAEEMLPAVMQGRVDLTIIGAETHDPYNRIMIAEYAAGEIGREALTTADTADFVTAGARVVRGRRVVRIDRASSTVVLDADERVAYDRLVIATGARSNVPLLDGLERIDSDDRSVDDALTAGVCVVRSLEDAERVRRVVAAGGRVVVLGAGVLGIEFALLLAEGGAAPHLAHFGPIPMPRQLDRGAAHVLTGALDRAGVTVVPNMRAEAIATHEVDGIRSFRALISSDGRRIEGDLLVLSCGVQARSELAAESGLRVGRGILVDDHLRSWTDARIHAIGDVAHLADPEKYAHDREVPGGPSGLIGPGWRQADWLATAIVTELAGDEPQPFTEDIPGVVLMKASQVDLVSAGEVQLDPFAPTPLGEEPREVALWADPRHGTYVKMTTTAGVLDGFVAVGMPRAAAELAVLYQRRGELPSDRSLLLRMDSAEASLPVPQGRDATVCMCNAVTVGQIEDAVAEHSCLTVEDVGACTRAGTGCGGCRARIAEMLTRLEVAPS
ncbi:MULTISPECIES: FAD-dependent oxidoreductase [unclassified Microbacterium]|uniref:FAD-dependent oxidoreductase n=1 Tax=unclassified Microbacterium TaxID=2609290 RepID=UPI000EAAC9B0|nr:MULTISPECIES: FAD-dependent oxidoreductase [unclassified Microbacterium]MBT2483303.1 NAD(P)/FAD-dependent oxidoreductase [Microbacterium sp. ISL-108]RKN66341.1 NAD(P)/FAD-dependent oxidoreductase [Microbacterium sp. CGR2]